MRAFMFAMLLSAPIAAQAQTPRDLGRLIWGSADPAISVEAAPRIGLTAPGGAGPADLARLSSTREEASVRGAAPTAAFASGATPRDLARLLGPARGLVAAPPALFAARTSRPHG